MSPSIPYVNLAAQNRALRAELIEALDRVLAHGQFINGPEVAAFEAEVARALGVEHVVGVSNGTDALVMALKLVGVAQGDEVITPAHGFVATATAIRLVGATPVFVDIDERTMLVDPAAVDRAVTSRTKVVLPVHLSGCAADVEALENVCRRRGLALVEDCAQAIGATERGRSVGTAGIGCFSLHPLKVLGALGDGGFITVRTAEEARRLRQMRNIGLVDRDHCESVDGNCRLDALQAAFLLAKLRHLPEWLAARRAHAAAYRADLAGLVSMPPDDARGTAQVYSAFVIRHARRDALAAFLLERGIETKVHYPIPIHRQAAFLPWRTELPVTDRVCAQILSLPVSPELSPAGRHEVVAAVRAFAERK